MSRTRRTAYSRPFERGEGAIDLSDAKPMTKQEFRDECDINNIMAKFVRTGQLPPAVGIARYGDFSSVGTYQESLEVLRIARQQFDALPSKVRDRFRNDPALMLSFIADKDNLAEAKSLGLLKEEEAPPAPVKVEVINTPAK